VGGNNPGSLSKDRYCGQALGFCPNVSCPVVIVGPVRSAIL
jgi:hypothetical protein